MRALAVALVMVTCGVMAVPELWVGQTPAYAAPAPRQRMPDVSRSVQVATRTVQCAPGVGIEARYYNSRGDGDATLDGSDISLYFMAVSSVAASRPYMAVVWAPPAYERPERMMMDLDLNGYADIVGSAGDEAFAGGACTTLAYYLRNRKP